MNYKQTSVKQSQPRKSTLLAQAKQYQDEVRKQQALSLIAAKLPITGKAMVDFGTDRITVGGYVARLLRTKQDPSVVAGIVLAAAASGSIVVHANGIQRQAADVDMPVFGSDAWSTELDIKARGARILADHTA